MTLVINSFTDIVLGGTGLPLSLDKLSVRALKSWVSVSSKLSCTQQRNVDDTHMLRELKTTSSVKNVVNATCSLVMFNRRHQIYH